MKTPAILLWVLAIFMLGCKAKHNATNHDDKERGKIIIRKERVAGDVGKVIGTIKDVKTGEPVMMATILMNVGASNKYVVQTDADGNFSLSNVTPGEYQITIKCMDYEQLESSVKVEAGYKYTLEVTLYNRPIRVEKPLIYLYPTREQTVSVVLSYQGKLSHTYPAYPASGWNVTARPDGTLHDENGKEYYALFWEGVPDHPFTPHNGFIVPGKETAAFLEERLAYLGLSSREANEFIVYWLPRMENNPYNFIHFSGAEYENMAALSITPQPETLIRVMMLTQPLTEKMDMPVQDMSSMKKTRKGFTVVEWGGSVIHSIPTNN